MPPRNHIGRKVKMTQLFREDGRVVPVTVLEVGPLRVIQPKTEDTKDGYRALVVGIGKQNPRRLTKPLRGHYERWGVDPARVVREVDYPEGEEYAPGDEIKVDAFQPGQLVDVVGRSKGRGFSGTIKRHGFARGPKAHGSKNYREPGSTGMCTTPSHVLKGKRMAGQHGNARRTVRNLEVVHVDAEHNLLYVKGAVPGPPGGVVTVRVARAARRAHTGA